MYMFKKKVLDEEMIKQHHAHLLYVLPRYVCKIQISI